MIRLGEIMRRILRSSPTMGSGKVSAILRPGEISLEGRGERVLVAGNSMPQVGEWIPFVEVGPGRLVATHNLPQVMGSGATTRREVRFPINLTGELLYGDELDVGYYCYAASWDPDEGGVELDSDIAWMETKAAEEPPGTYLHFPNIFLWGGGYGDPGNWDNGYYFFLHTVYAEGIGETDAYKPPLWYEHFLVPAYPSYSKKLGISLCTAKIGWPMRNPLLNGRARVYCAGPYAEEYTYKPPDNEFRLLWEGVIPSDEYWMIPFSDPPAEDADRLPSSNTLSMTRVGLTLGFDEDDAPTDDVTRLLLYRSTAQVQELPEPPQNGALAEMPVPLQPIELSQSEAWEMGKRDGMIVRDLVTDQVKNPEDYSIPTVETYHFIDDTGPSIGDPPDLPWGEDG